MKTKSPKKISKPKLNKFYISIALGTETIKGSGASMLEAIKAVPVPVKIFTKGIISLKNGDKEASLVWIVPKVKRIFHPLAQVFLAKQFNLLLK